jgi:hypothetical protein
MRSWLPQARVIFLLREPVTRALSSYRHWQHYRGSLRYMGLGGATSFNEYVLAELAGCRAARCQLSLQAADAAGGGAGSQEHVGVQQQQQQQQQQQEGQQQQQQQEGQGEAVVGVGPRRALGEPRRLLASPLPPEPEHQAHEEQQALEQVARALQDAAAAARQAGSLGPGWQDCYAGCHYNKRDGVSASADGSVRLPGPRCQGLEQDLPVSRGLYAHQLRWWRQLFGDGQITVLSYHRLMAEPRAEMRRLLESLGLQGAASEAWLAGGAPSQEGGRVGEAGGRPAGSMPELKAHGVSSATLERSCAALRALAQLYEQQEPQLRELLQEMGAQGAMHSSERVFPDAWQLLQDLEVRPAAAGGGPQQRRRICSEEPG